MMWLGVFGFVITALICAEKLLRRFPWVCDRMTGQ